MRASPTNLRPTATCSRSPYQGTHMHGRGAGVVDGRGLDPQKRNLVSPPSSAVGLPPRNERRPRSELEGPKPSPRTHTSPTTLTYNVHAYLHSTMPGMATPRRAPRAWPIVCLLRAKSSQGGPSRTRPPRNGQQITWPSPSPTCSRRGLCIATRPLPSCTY